MPTVTSRAHLICAACGYDWFEQDSAKVEQSWKAQRAWEAELEKEEAGR